MKNTTCQLISLCLPKYDCHEKITCHKEKSVTSEMFSDKFLSKILKKFGGSWLTVFDVNDVNPLPSLSNALP